MIFRIIIFLGYFFFNFSASAQTISGNFSKLFNQEIKLEGFNGFNVYTITNGSIDAKGNFKLNFITNDYGVGYLIAEDKKPLFVILCGEDIQIVGETLSLIETIKVKKGKENLWFEQYSKEHPKREQALNAWTYLEQIYLADSLFSIQKSPSKAIQLEKQRIKKEDDEFLAKLPTNSYVSWFLPTRKLVSSVSTIAQYRPKEISSTISAFRALDYTDLRLYKSGLFKDAIESHFWLLENSGKSLDSVFIEMKLSIDAMMIHLIKDEKKLNEVTDYLFDLLERHSLFQASEYLAIKVLNEVSCTINSDLAKQLETYRVMKKGNIATDILFDDDFIAPSYDLAHRPKKLSDLKSKYTLVVFGASWCKKCNEELPEIAKQYLKWKSQGVEVVFISLDENKEQFKDFVKNFPFISVCDYQKWKSSMVIDYYVFGTPTLYLLNGKREILLRPNSVKQMDAWVDWYLVQGNN
jgi:thiol-disulfide isomerase/thioredoxin